MRIAIYARVSTEDKGQDPENQLRQLRQWCASAGHELVHEYVDHESGRKGTKDRKQFAALFEDAHKRKLDCVLFWALEAWSRPSCTCKGWLPTAWDSTVTQSRTWPPIMSSCAISCSPYWPRWPRSRRRR